MGDEVSGLVRDEHQGLRELFAATRASLEASDDEARLEAAIRLREALEVHFAQEDSLYYPTILALRPEHRKALRACTDAHEEFLDRAGRLVESVERGGRDETLRAFHELVESFGQHEATEEEVLAAIERETRGASR